MAIVRSIAVGKARKSAGNVTFSTVKGQVVMKEKPLAVKNPNTPAQQLQREKMTKLVYLWQHLGKYAKDGITRVSKYGSQYNRFVSNNMPLISDIWRASSEELNDILAGVLLTEGSMSQINPHMQLGSASITASIPMAGELKENAKVGDKLVVICFDNTSGKAVKVTKVLSQSDINEHGVSLEFEPAGGVAAEGIVIAVYFLSADSKISSTSFTTAF